MHILYWVYTGLKIKPAIWVCAPKFEGELVTPTADHCVHHVSLEASSFAKFLFFSKKNSENLKAFENKASLVELVNCNAGDDTVHRIILKGCCFVCLWPRARLLHIHKHAGNVFTSPTFLESRQGLLRGTELKERRQGWFGRGCSTIRPSCSSSALHRLPFRTQDFFQYFLGHWTCWWVHLSFT